MKLILDGFNLMIIGMGAVFIFLIVMIALMELVAKLVAPFSHLLETPTQRPRSRGTSGGDSKTEKLSKDNDKALIAAVVAAVQQHRKRRQ